MQFKTPRANGQNRIKNYEMGRNTALLEDTANAYINIIRKLNGKR
jgi:hypothetical protein